MTKNLPRRRIASNLLITPEGKHLTQYVVELDCGVVKEIYPLMQELPSTEWLPGTIVLKENEEGDIKAYYKELPIT